MKKPWLVIAGVILAVVAVGVVIGVLHQAERGKTKTAALDPASAAQNLTVTIDDQPFTLVDGVAEVPAAADSATVNTLRVVGDPVGGDVTDDGKPEAALLLSNEPGGSGTFYYAVLAVNEDGAWHATNALPLGDRIKPEDVEFTGGRFVYRFLVRAAGEPMAGSPKVEKLVPIRFDPSTEEISVGV